MARRLCADRWAGDAFVHFSVATLMQGGAWRHGKDREEEAMGVEEREREEGMLKRTWWLHEMPCLIKNDGLSPQYAAIDMKSAPRAGNYRL